MFSQNRNIESIADSISKLLKEFRKTKNLEIPKKAYVLAEKTKVDSIIKNTYIDFGLRSHRHNDTLNLSISEKKLFIFFNRTQDSVALARHYLYKAMLFTMKVKLDSSFNYYNKSKDISELLKDSIQVARSYLFMGRLQIRARDYFGSEKSLIKGLQFIEPLNEVYYTYQLYFNLGRVLRFTERSEEARKIFLKYFETIMRTNIDKNAINTSYYCQIAKSYEAEFNYAKAREYYKKSISFKGVKDKYPFDFISGLEGYSYNNFMLGNKDLALKGYLQVIELRKKLGHRYSIIYSHSLLGEYYASTDQISKAIYHTKKALSLSRKHNNSERILENLFLLSKLVKGEQGRKYLEEHFYFNDSIFKRERALKNQFAKVRYETEKKEKENANLKADNQQKQLLIEKEQQQKIMGWLVAGTSILFIAFGYVVVNNRRKKILYQAKLEQVEAREKERQQIAKSLHDEVAGDIRILHKKLEKNNLLEESKELDRVKDNVRNLSHQLSSVSFDEVSFKDQIINLVSDYLDADFMTKVKEINSVHWSNINSSIKRTLFLCIRESLQNIDKYADAKNVTLTFGCSKKVLHLSIKDDGKGFDINSKKSGIGLKNMKERVEEINGYFFVESELEKGTSITIEIPNNGK